MFEFIRNIGKVFEYTIKSYILIGCFGSIVLIIYNFDIYRASALLLCDTLDIQSTIIRILVFFLAFAAYYCFTALLTFIALIFSWTLALRSFINPIEYNSWLLKAYMPVTSKLLPLKIYDENLSLGYTHNILIGFSIIFIISFICVLIYFLFLNYKPKNNL